jgi:DNA-binding NtrC family response regulator
VANGLARMKRCLGNLFRVGELPPGVGLQTARGVLSCYADFTPSTDLMATILIVEDEQFIRQSAEWIVEDLGHSPLMADDLESALLHLKAAGPIDALFVDIRLRTLELGGYEIADQAIRIRPDMRVLYTSGTPLHDGMTARFVAGGQFIQKPYSPAQLGSSVEDLLDQVPG